ncbi:hypothetical protein HGG71_11575 [Rhodobacteraceae bacterium R_SAG2]|nr:hypothetical protein [Rhodobacteraceae bacterium R_SAG2]
MATYEDYMKAARNADAAGDEAAARQLVQAAIKARGTTAQPTTQPANPDADMSVWGRIKDNVMGVDDGVMSWGEKLGTGLNNAGESLTLGIVGDEAAGAADALIGRGDYATRRDKYRADQEQFSEENPVASFASEMAPMLIPGMGAASLAGKATTAGGKVARAAVGGAIPAAIYGAAEAEGGLADRAASGAVSGAVGGVIGAAAPKIANAVKGVPNRLKQLFGMAEQRPTVPMLKRVKNEAYKLVDESGEVFGGDDMQALYGKVRGLFDDNHYVEEVDNASRAVLSVLEKRQGQPTTLSQLDSIRQNLWKRYANAKDQPQILEAIKSIDDLIDSKAGASELMGAARAANAKYAKSQLIEDAFTKASDQTASTGSGGNIANKYKQALTSIINNPSKAKFFSQEEISLMRDVIHDDPIRKIQRLTGKLSPEGNGLMMALHTIGGVSSGGATLPIMAAGAAAKRGADSSVVRGANRVQDVVSGFRPAQPNIQPSLLGVGAASAPIAEEAGRGLLDMFP